MNKNDEIITYHLSRVDHTILNDKVEDGFKIMTTDKGPDKPVIILKTQEDWYKHFFEKELPDEKQSK